MPPILALLICIIFVAGLLWIEHIQNPKASFALWIPTIWMLIAGSRPLGRWPGLGQADFNIEEGSQIDRLVIILLMSIAILIIYRRRIEWSLILKENISLIVLFLFAGISILWSDFPFLSFKRWIKLLACIPIAMVVLSEKSPLEALESLFRRCAYILIPFSIILIKYYPGIGRIYGRWSGLPLWTGVTTTKNALGWLCAASALFFIWVFIKNRRNFIYERTWISKLVDLTILIMSIYLLKGSGFAYSATSISILFIGIILLITLYKFREVAKSVSKISLFMVGILLILLSFSEKFVENITSILGRDETFTGRKEMWDMLIKAGSHSPLIGRGYGGYFGTPGNEFAEAFGGSVWGHNGFLSVYVELGIIGIMLLIIFYIKLYLKWVNEFRTNFNWSIFSVSLLVAILVSNYTESLFLNSSTYFWNLSVFLSIIISYLNLKRNNNYKVFINKNDIY